MELNETKVEELDVESAVNFALFAISDASRFWIEASLEQKQRFQQSLFPDGLALYGKFHDKIRDWRPYGNRSRVAAVKG